MNGRANALWVDGWCSRRSGRFCSGLAGCRRENPAGDHRHPCLRLGLDSRPDLSGDQAAKRAYAIALPADADWTLARYLSQAHLASPPAALACALQTRRPADSLLDLARFGQVLPALLIWPATEETENPIDALIVEPAALAGLQASEQAAKPSPGRYPA